MDYERIYREFIADRRRLEPALTGYSERHHIRPRSAGGSDDPENLIQLTPEDHFFAHLVLAKWLNTMSAWGAVMVMHERARRSTIFRRKARLRYGWARRRYGRLCVEHRRGEANPNYKPELITLKRSDGREEARTRSEWNEAGVSHAPLCGLISGKSRSYRGWMLPGTDPTDTGRAAAGRAKRNKTRFNWRHLDGRHETLNCYDLAEKHGLRLNDLTAVARGAHALCAGWYIEGRKVGWPSGRTHFKDDRIHEIVSQDGARMAGTQAELAGRQGLSQQDVSAIVTGNRRSARGWMLRATADAGYKPRKWTRRADIASPDQLLAAS